ncbi:MAG TPA: DUF5666 domain-containing protein [Candidatus Paceibacterota bacterium]|jgi:hypothetical protein|nr:DUF5666 domain-containing protein [Candidatus Paceibacterota bacterium]
MRERILYALIGLLMAAGFLVAVPAFAQSEQGAPPPGPGGWGGPGHGRGGTMHMMPGVFGTVSSVNGDTIVLQSKAFGRSASSTSPTTYTIDATNATVFKNGATSTVSSIASGDTLMVQGTVSGTNVTATRINDGVPAQGGLPPGQRKGPGALGSLQGNGEPVIGGSVTAISGTTLTVTNKSSVTYSVDAANATVVVKNATSSVSAIQTGDNVFVQGTVNGSAVTASSVIDQGQSPSQNSSSNGTGGGAPPMMRGFGGIFGALGNLFHNLFGFF